MPPLEGLIGDEECAILADLAAEVPAEQAIVELGSYRGKSTAYLASRAAARVYAVDRWVLGGQRVRDMGYDSDETWMAFQDQLRRVGVWEKVTAIVADTVDAGRKWKGPPVGLLFIDADHREVSVRADLTAWERHCVGAIAFDDYSPRFPGVVKVADELATRRGAAAQTGSLRVVWP